MNLFTNLFKLRKNLLLILFALSSSLAIGQMSAFCEADAYHFGNPAEVPSHIKLTITNVDANSMIVEIESADADPVDFLLVNNGSGATFTPPNPNTTVVNGKITTTLSWVGVPPTDVVLEILWSKASFGGNWQLTLPFNPITVPFAATCPTASPDLILTAVFDADLSGGLPKGVEVYVANDVADLSVYGLGSANNGGGTDGQEFTFPAVAATAGDFIYVASESASFMTYFGFAPDYTTGAMAINGDDAVELFCNGAVIDTYGDPNVNGDFEVWDYTDGFAYRIANTGPDGTFVPANWTYSGRSGIDGCTDNASCGQIIPLGSFFLGVAPCGDLFFSEYIEGSSSNKCIEIYNPTANAIDMGAGDYWVTLFSNGSSSPGNTLQLSGTLASGNTYVICNPSADGALLAAADITNAVTFYNGDDALVLTKGGEYDNGGTVIDALGKVGEDPGSSWSGNGASTVNQTLVRKATVLSGDTDELNDFDPSVEWDDFAINTFDNIGSHTSDCIIQSCTIDDVVIDNIGDCNDNGTADLTDDFFTLEFTVEFDGAPAAGNLDVEVSVGGVNAAATGSVAVASLASAATHTFTVNVPSLGGNIAVSAEFSDDMACSLTKSNLGTAPSACSSNPCGELFFSEYIEGSGVNKCVEIYNPTANPIDLAAGNYVFNIYFNGNTAAGASIDLMGTIEPGDVYVICDDGAAAAFIAEADLTPSNSFFNGDDAVTLTKSGYTIDALGQVGVDPGSQWGTGLNSTANNTILKRIDIQQGDSNPFDAFDPANEWIGFQQNYSDDLGSHCGSCNAVSGTPCDGAFEFADPCGCLDNASTVPNGSNGIDGQFSERIEINSLNGGPLPAGISFTVSSATNAFDAFNVPPVGVQSPEVPVAAGTAFQFDPVNNNYFLDFVHKDGIGYSMTIVSGGNTIGTIANTCFYPNPVITNIDGDFCLNSPAFTLDADVGGAAGTGQFFVDGVATNMFDPAAMGVGSYQVDYVFDADAALGYELIDGNPVAGAAQTLADAEADPGCVQSVFGFIEVVETPSTIACNDEVQVSLDENCEAWISPDMVLEGDFLCEDDYVVSLHIAPNFAVSNPLTAANLDDVVIATVTHLVSGNSCWGTIILEDKLVVEFTCPNATIVCTEEINSVPTPTYDDNCTQNIVAQLTNQGWVDEDICDDNTMVWFRNYVAVDTEGNVTDECTQLITIDRTTDVDFPNDVEFTCEQYQLSPNIVDAAPFGAGVPSTNNTPINTDDFCKYTATHSDVILPTCGFPGELSSPVFKIVRTWTVLDWCTGQVISTNNAGEDNVQIIKVIDETPPVLTSTNLTVGVNIPGEHPQPCLSMGFINPANITDCTGVDEVHIYTPVGEAVNGLIPAPGLGLGFHTITFVATDVCGNQTALDVTLEVVDNTAPTAICDEITEINLSSDGKAYVPASVFDDGSHDNCCLDNFQVRKMSDNCGNPSDLSFGDDITFCCEDIDASPIMVAFRANDCFGNSNDCMVEVYVNDKIIPTISCPDPATIDCDDYLDNYEEALEIGDFAVLDGFGAPAIWDNCEAILTSSTTVNINQCQEGTIIRSWSVNDPYDNGPVNCSQTIFVENVSNWAVMFPDDIFVDCGVDVPDFGEPTLYEEDCELLAVSFEDELFTNVPDACYKIVRQWTVINWCTVGDEIDEAVIEPTECESNIDYNGNGINCALNAPIGNNGTIIGHGHRTFRENQGEATDLAGAPTTEQDGYITYQQVIKVNDTVEPVFVDCSIEDMCIFDGCSMTVNLPMPEVTDCSAEVTITVESTDMPAGSGSGFGPYVNVPVGTYTVVYKATDNCGNWSVCQASFTVSDCKNPTPYCVDGLIIEIMNTNPAMVDVWASDFDAGSFDNCGVKCVAFSDDCNDTQRVYDCDQLGEQLIQLWVQDIYDNWDFCETFVVIQNNMGSCDDPLVVNGNIATEENEDVSDVTVQINESGNIQTSTTGNDGMFSFTGVAGADYTITPEKDINPLNGVTTFDLVQISKHILNSDVLDSPYQMIAADANKSGSITTFDLVQIRKLILFIDPEFPNNTSWRFIPQDFQFTNPANPFADNFPEVINMNNITQTQLSTDFVAVKIGDVNGSANANQLLGADDRNVNGQLTFQTADIDLVAGQTYEIPFTAKNFNNFGYQFTLAFDGLELVNIEEAVASEENFGTTLLSENVLTTSFSNAKSVELSNDVTVFNLVFKATKSVKLSDVLAINSTYTTAEAYASNGDVQDVNLEFLGATAVSNEFALYQNTPNPFAENTQIGFNLPEATKATITVSDVSGRILKVIENDFAKGFNSIEINKDELPVTGVLYYQLKTDANSATMKMILTK